MQTKAAHERREAVAQDEAAVLGADGLGGEPDEEESGKSAVGEAGYHSPAGGVGDNGGLHGEGEARPARRLHRTTAPGS